MTTQFDTLKTDLTGTHLIEAGAGTGKTYTIAGIYLRLVLEKGLGVDQILVVTFTRAATAELKDRIRNNLLQVKAALWGTTVQDPLIQALAARSADNIHQAVNRVNHALIDFDRAAIFTIHGFCQRILFENAFETGAFFENEMLGDQTELVEAITDDFWRKWLHDAPSEMAAFLQARAVGPADFVDLWSMVKTPTINLIHPDHPDRPQNTQDPKMPPRHWQPVHLAAFQNALQTVRRTWDRERAAIIAALCDPALKGNVYGTLKPHKDQTARTNRDIKTDILTHAFERWTARKPCGYPLFDQFDRLTAAKLEATTRKGATTPQHPFFNQCDTLAQATERLTREMTQRLTALRVGYIDYMHRELAQRKKDRQVLFYDDLLVKVHRAVVAANTSLARLLTTKLRAQYTAALVDEFQDTDQIQSDIFFTIFQGMDPALFMIGDPKQAIYGFRGADIFSYLNATRTATHKHTLIHNWRSAPALITAINTLFAAAPNPFVFETITFQDAVAAATTETNAHTRDATRAPFTLWYLERPDTKPHNKTDAVPLIAASVAREIARLINDARKPAAPGDIAVLVRTNRQAQIVKKHLAALHVPAVIYNAGNVFKTKEARILYRVLTAIAEPGNETNLRVALVTPLIDANAHDLDTRQPEPPWWEPKLEAFRHYQHLWRNYGIMRMLRDLMYRERVSARLLPLPEGERSVTNLLQLADLLHHKSSETVGRAHHAGVPRLLKWLAEQMQTDRPGADAHQLRLESDDQAVNIVTIHKSKGLEYEIVFCPFTWEASAIRKHRYTFHDTTAGNRLTLQLADEDQPATRKPAQKELLAENLRLLYVALTRARKRCYLIWGCIRDAETSAPAYLFHAPRPTDPDDPLAGLQELWKAKNDTALKADLQHIADRAQGTIRLASMPLAHSPAAAHLKTGRTPPAPLSGRTFTGLIDDQWRITSYSALTAQKNLLADQAIEMPDHDLGQAQILVNEPSPPDTLADRKTIFQFPKGGHAGIFFHDLLEHLDFTGHDEELVQQKLRQYDFDPDWHSAVNTMLTHLLTTPLPAGPNTLTLAQVKPRDRINEMAFHFPLKTITPRTLTQVCTRHQSALRLNQMPRETANLQFAPTKGYLKGFIDLVCRQAGKYYIIDWKSNHLGNHIEAYTAAQIEAVMLHELYVLQYLLYTLAFDRYMQWRQPGYRYSEDFGGVFYLFLRGFDTAGPQYGVFHDRPDEAFIRDLDQALIVAPSPEPNHATTQAPAT